MTARHEYADLGTLAGDVASRVIELLEDLQATGVVPHVTLTGGSVADEIHRELGRIGPTSGVDWGAVEFWFSDERFVPADSPDRNAGQARSAFLDAVGARRVHEMAAADGDWTLAEAAAAYSDEVRASDTHAFHLTMLGMGPDGHVASIFPGHPAADLEAIAVPVTDSPKPPPERISLSTDALSHSERVWFVIAGDEKRAIAERVWAEDASLPAARVRGQAETVWFLA
jgi:6-phosphogluconolactonase